MTNNRFEIDMCNGPLMSKLISFSLPLMFSGILQLLFNAVDLIVVGRLDGSDSLAAVGATSALINLFINLFIGISLGANVCAARCFAQGNLEKMSKVLHTAMFVAIVSGFAVLIVGQFLARPALELMDTPTGVIDKSVLYMRIYFLGTPFFMVYNFGAAILRAVGDTKRPMAFLIISGAINAGLNVLLVSVFKLNVAGVAIATVFSQIICCVLVILVLLRCPEGYRLYFGKISADAQIAKTIIKIGLPAGLQSTVINASNCMLQSSVNSFGQYAMAGYTAANNLFGFMYTSANSITQGCMSFTSQNLGVRKYSRMKKVLAESLVLELVVCLLLGSVAYFFGNSILSIYNSSPVVINYGIEILSLTSLTYFLCGFMDCIPGALRGMGRSAVPMLLSIIGTVGTRVIWIYGFFPHNHDIKFLFASYPLSWIATIIMQAVCYAVIIKKHYSRKHYSDLTEGSYES